MSSVELLRASAPVDPDPGPVIYTRGLRKTYRGGKVALAGLDLDVNRGEVFGFLGPNGAGKTTAVKLLTGLVRPSAGEALVLGAPIGDVAVRRRIGYLPELFRYQAWLSAEEVVGYHCRLLRLPKVRQATEVKRVLARVGLADRASDRVGRFSKGMQQRLGLAVALVGEPELVFLDEPTSALDPLGRHDVRQVIRELRRNGVTVFLNTHLLDEAQHVCDRVAVIDRGRTLALGKLSDLLRTQARIRLSVTGLGRDGWAALERFGPWTHDGEWSEAATLGPGRVPELVSAIVAAGGQVHAVVPTAVNLEERFLQILGRS